MLMFMTERSQRRRSSRGMVPDPLILKKNLEEPIADFACLNTPPPTAAKSATGHFVGRMATKDPVLSMQMPMTPSSPLEHDESFDVQSPIKEEEEDEVSTPESITDSVTTSPAKRLREEEIPTSPSKRIMREEDLIPNPLFGLQQLGIPMAYIHKNLLRASARFLNSHESSVCLIKAVRPRTKPSRGLLRATIIPKTDPEQSFSMGFAYKPQGTSADTTDDDADETPKASRASSTIMPLHIEVAVMRAPLLGRLLLSGHVFKGDMIEIELPHPQLFPDVMQWMYTGRLGKKETELKECIDALWGRL